MRSTSQLLLHTCTSESFELISAFLSSVLSFFSCCFPRCFLFHNSVDSGTVMWGLSPSWVTSPWLQMRRLSLRDVQCLPKVLRAGKSQSEDLAQTWLQKLVFSPAMLCRPFIQQMFTWFLPQAKPCAVLCRERMFGWGHSQQPLSSYPNPQPAQPPS